MLLYKLTWDLNTLLSFGHFPILTIVKYVDGWYIAMSTCLLVVDINNCWFCHINKSKLRTKMTDYILVVADISILFLSQLLMQPGQELGQGRGTCPGWQISGSNKIWKAYFRKKIISYLKFFKIIFWVGIVQIQEEKEENPLQIESKFIDARQEKFVSK